MTITFDLVRPEDTTRLGRLLGEELAAGTILALIGGLGAGKTWLTQGIAEGLGVPEDRPVVSPTYTLANEYSGRLPLFHLDVYRLEGDEFEESGLDEYFYRGGVTVIEWADRLDRLPRPRLEIVLAITPAGGRRAELRVVGPGFEGFLDRIKRRFGDGAGAGVLS